MPAPTSSLAGRLAERDRAADLGLRGWIDQQRGAELGRRQHREAVTSVRGVHAITRVSGYPDPRVTGSGNGVQVTISPGTANPDSPAFRAADRACHHLLPGLTSTSASSGHDQEQDLKFADCMRSHGVPDFPDADHDGAFTLPTTMNQQAPQFERATTACAHAEPNSLSMLTQSPAGS